MSPSFHDEILEKGLLEQIPPRRRVSALAHAALAGCVDFLRPSVCSPVKKEKRKALRDTAYLDGLRGFAALLVYWLHHQLWAHQGVSGDRILENAFGFDRQYYFICLPGIRTFFSGGHFAVTVFFVISGYVLSTKPMKLVHHQETALLADNLTSALFRRWIRLFLPVIVTTFLWMTSWHVFGFAPSNPKPQSRYLDEVWNWYAEFKNFSFVFKTEGELWFNYNFHAWSIPMEFRGSITIYTALLAFANCTRNKRLLCETGLIFYFLYVTDGWFCAMFVAGMLLCDLDLLAAEKNLPRFFSKFEPYKTSIFYCLFVVSIYLGGVPSNSFDLSVLRRSPGWYYLSFLKPQAVFNYKWFYLFWASTLLVGSLPRIPWIKALFETRVCQYLGHISFAFYLVHGPVLWILGDRLYAATGLLREGHSMTVHAWINRFPLPRFGPFGLELNFVIPHILLLPLTLWLAEIVTKTVDEPSVRFSQWAYKTISS